MWDADKMLRRDSFWKFNQRKKKKLNQTWKQIPSLLIFCRVDNETISGLDKKAAALGDVWSHGIWSGKSNLLRETGLEPLAVHRLIGLYLRALLLQLLWVDEYISMWHAQSWRQPCLSLRWNESACLGCCWCENGFHSLGRIVSDLVCVCSRFWRFGRSNWRCLRSWLAAGLA